MSREHNYFTSPKMAVRRLQELSAGPAMFDGANAGPLADLTPEQCAQLKKQFDLWWKSWVAPCVQTLERRHCKPKPVS